MHVNLSRKTLKRNRHLGGHKWQDNIKMNLKEIQCEDLENFMWL
jgi:hypothetical protein